MTRRRLVALAVLAVAVIVVVGVAKKHREGPSAKPLPGGPLRELAQRDGGRVFGTAVDALALKREPGYRSDLAGQFSAVTPENAMKWAVIEPSKGDYDFSDADRIVDFARAEGQRVRGHNLVWYAQNPGWISGLSSAELKRALDDHIRRVVGHYRGKVTDWDTVNEPITDGGALRKSIWERKLGPGYIAEAFRVAHDVDPDARLWINEIGAESVGPKSDRLLALVKALRSKGLQVGGVGFQGHFSNTGVPSTFRANLRRFTALGIQVAITEMDVALPNGAKNLSLQARIYGDAVRDCRAVDGCTGMTVWGFTDRHSWIPSTEPGFGTATLLDDDLEPKPAYDAVARALRGSARR